jgi:DNA repair exonuclease SbcCD ATPase subunit
MPGTLRSRLTSLEEIAAAQQRLADALAAELRAQSPWWEALKASARGRLLRWAGPRRPPGAVLAEQLTLAQRRARELSLWAERAAVEARELEAERASLTSELDAAERQEDLLADRLGEDRRALASTHAEMDAMPTRLSDPYRELEARARAIQERIARGDAQAKALSARQAELREALRAGARLSEAAARSESALRRLEQAASALVDRLDRLLGGLGAAANAQGLSEAVAGAVGAEDTPEALEALGRETAAFLQRRGG